MKNVTYITIFLYILFLLLNSIIDAKEVIKPKPKPVPVEPREMKYIKVTYPNGGEEWKVGDSYNIKWESNGIQGNVNIILQLASSPNTWFWILNNTLNSGSIFYTVSSGLTMNDNKFKVVVKTMDDTVRDESNVSFTILNEVDLIVDIKDVECIRKGDGFNVKFKIGIKNNGTRILEHVLFDWIINSYSGYTPTELILQEGAGWSKVYPNRWYDSDQIEYDIPDSKLKLRRILIEAYVDSKNNFNEPSWVRDDNKKIKIIDPPYPKNK